MLWGADIETLELVFKTCAQRSLHAELAPVDAGDPLRHARHRGRNLIFLHPLELAFCLLNLPPWMAFGLDAAAEVAAARRGAGLYPPLDRSRGAGLGELSVLRPPAPRSPCFTPATSTTPRASR